VPEPQTKVDARLALRAYQAVIDAGTRDDDWTRLGELAVATDFDGYTVTLTDGSVTARVLFHSRVAIDAPGGRALENFVRLLEKVVDEQGDKNS
jgi:hypothetical protein